LKLQPIQVETTMQPKHASNASNARGHQSLNNSGIDTVTRLPSTDGKYANVVDKRLHSAITGLSTFVKLGACVDALAQTIRSHTDKQAYDKPSTLMKNQSSPTTRVPLMLASTTSPAQIGVASQSALLAIRIDWALGNRARIARAISGVASISLQR
jgi:hypothetical protein